jgi:glycosyltransferase involved in cell wall biosynthesis
MPRPAGRQNKSFVGAQLRATIATRVYTPEGSAAAYRLAALARAFQRAGYTTTVLTTRPPGLGIRTPGVRRWPVLRDRSGAVRGYLQYASFDIPLFFRLLFGPRANVVVVEPPPTTGIVSRAACWLRRTPYVYFSADVATSAVIGMKTARPVIAVVRAMERSALRGARLVLAVSPAVRQEVIDLGAAAERVAMVGTGIDTTHFFSDPASASPEKDPYLIYAGMMSEFQGARIFIEAFARVAKSHPAARLEMFGGGVEHDELTRLAKQLAPDQIRFHGSVDAEVLVPWLRAANAGLASIRPDRGYLFAFPTKALASTGSGSPVIYVGAGPLRAIVTDNKLGWSVDWEIDAVATAMDEALRAKPTRVARDRLARWTAENYSLDAVATSAVARITESIDA